MDGPGQRRPDGAETVAPTTRLQLSGPARYQLVLCDGPRCRARGFLQAHHAHLRTRLQDPGLAARVSLGSHACLGRCPAGPSLVVRRLCDDAPPDPTPGMYALAGGCHYHAVSEPLLDRILDEHCAGRPLHGRFQPY